MDRKTSEAKSQSDVHRFARYQALTNALLAKDFPFLKSEIYETLKHENRVFIGRVISDLERNGFLVRTGSRANSRYSWTAEKEAFDAGRWVDQQVFTATVKRSPSADRPRERLLRLSPSELKLSELLSILIRSGVGGESAIQAGEKLAALFGNDLARLSRQGRGELKQISRAMGTAAYCQIMAALELGKRLASQRPTESIPGPKIRETGDALAYCKVHFSRLATEAQQEEFHVVLLDEKHHVIKSEQITLGLLNQSLVHPREVFKPAIRESASALILVHNHPSGDPKPSREDKLITADLKRAADTLGLRILDHIILSKGGILSMVQEKVI
jgi:DNA repair protein RadC